MTEDQFVQLNRTFRVVSEEEIDSDRLDSVYDWNSWGLRNKTGWNDIEQRFRSVILAEGGAGKTREMKERCNTLREKEMVAWFIELEMLGDDGVEDLLDMDPDQQLSDFTDWRDSSSRHAWIYLDAVDELKLKDGDFQRALFSLRKSIGAAHDRAHIIISCRPSDWDKIDIGYFSKQLPAPTVFEGGSESEPNERANESGEERFLAPLKGSPGIEAKNNVDELDEENNARPEELKIFQLQVLTRNQVKEFASRRSPEIADQFLKAVEDHDRWAFTRQPQDLIELLTLWQDKGSLGTYKEQHEAFLLSSLRERDGRPGEASQLSQQNAREGAERLSLSLALSKKRTLLNVSEGTPVGSSPSSVCPRELLQNWSSSEIKALLRLRTFDPPSYERIKFHRRDLQEYLAAGRLINLSKAGNDSMKKLCALLFSKGPFGEEVLLPTMKGIAVWTASDSSEFGIRARTKIINIAPELLLNEGDPDHLPVSSKIDIINRIVELHSGDSRRSLPYSPASLKRFAAPQLSQTINTIFESGERTDSVVCLLLGLVKEGKIADCSEMLKQVAMEPKCSNHWRALAVMGLVACNQDQHLGEIVRKILESPGEWPGMLLSEIIDEIAPEHLQLGQLESLLKTIDSRDDAAIDELSRPMQRLAEKIAGKPTDTAKLKSVLASLILGSQLPGSVHYHPHSRWSNLTPALQTLCLACTDPPTDLKCKEHFFDFLTAIWFRPEGYYGTSHIEELVEMVADAGIDRKLLFQWELEYALKHFPAEPDETVVLHDSLLRGYTMKDALWLEELVKSKETDICVRLGALLERIRLWNGEGRPQKEEAALRELGGDGGAIDENLNAYLAPKEPSAAEEEWKEIRRKRESEEKNRLAGWLEWRQKILLDTQVAFTDEALARTRHLMLEWLMADNGRNGSYQIWQGGKGVAAAFSEEIREAVASAYASYWRDAEVKTFSEQEGDRSKTSYSWIYALTGVSIESETPGWVTRLSDDDVRQATRIAMVEINGLASYIEQLIHDRPEPTKKVLSDELSAQWSRRFEVSYLPLLQDVANGSPSLKSLLLDESVDLLLEWSTPPDLTDEAFSWASHNLSQLLGIIQSCWDETSEEQQASLQSHCEAMLSREPKSKFSLEWLRLMFAIDLDRAIGLLEETIKAYPSSGQKDAAVYFFSSLFGDRYQRNSLNLVGSNPDPRDLSRLILIAHTFVVPGDDQQRPVGISFTPNERDEAEHARSSLVNMLINIDGPVADREIERLARSPKCASIVEYLRSRQRVRIENRADRGYLVTEISDIEDRFESAPRDRDSLFRVMMARLEDLQDFLDTDDFVPLLTLQRIDSEEEMQRAIAMLLKHASNGIYEVFREPEVKHRKRTDIQFCVPSFNVQSVIEIKVGEKPAWNVNALLEALEHQLVDRYLLQRNRKAGCFLITYGGHDSECLECGKGFKPRKKWKDPDSGKLLDFEGLIERLRVRAREIVEEHSGEICLEVFGLDLRNPSLRKSAGS